eukprot:7569857-Pyramimonas_sp.AAC.1
MPLGRPAAGQPGDHEGGGATFRRTEVRVVHCVLPRCGWIPICKTRGGAMFWRTEIQGFRCVLPRCGWIPICKTMGGALQGDPWAVNIFIRGIGDCFEDAQAELSFTGEPTAD